MSIGMRLRYDWENLVLRGWPGERPLDLLAFVSTSAIRDYRQTALIGPRIRGVGVSDRFDARVRDVRV